MTFTKAPWHLCAHLSDEKVDTDCGCGWVGEIYGDDGDHVIATIGPHCPKQVEGADMVPRYDRKTERDNARLIAKAPEMYELLTMLAHDELLAVGVAEKIGKLIAEIEGKP